MACEARKRARTKVLLGGKKDMKRKNPASGRGTSARRKSPPAAVTPEKLKRHSTARKLSAIERKRKMRIRRAKAAAILLVAFFGVSALLLALKARAAAPVSSSAEAMQEIQEEEAEPRLMQEELAPPLPSSPPVAAAEERAASSALPEPSQPAVPRGTGTLCFVFDDAGHNLFHLEPFLSLPFPCTIAVLPSLPHSAECAEKIRNAGKEVILHQPMQAVNLGIDPGPGAIMPGMTAEEIRAVVSANLDEIWPAAGLNNHEGSLITANARSMEAVFDVVEERALFFLDSRTTAETAAPEIAAERGMRILERAVFLDNSQDRDEILKAVMQGAESASRNGHAVMIGHVWSEELAEILSQLYPYLAAAGYKVSDLSALLASLERDEARQRGEGWRQ